MILLITSNKKGGIVQFSTQILFTCIELGHEAKLMLPMEAIINIPDMFRPLCIGYEKQNGIMNMKPSGVEDALKKINPDIIWFMDEGVVSKHIALMYKGDSLMMMTIHDIVPHLQYFNIRQWVREIIKKCLRRKVFRKLTKILLLSENSRKEFINRYPTYGSKALKMTLGAHVPFSNPEKPPEVKSIELNRYLLFFGRIDKYKGLDLLLDAYKTSGLSDNMSLVAAGDGQLTKKENMLSKQPGILLINRFIGDKEMIYLLENCEAVVLPYREITQSGVLSMAYHFNKPVIVSSLPGLVEFVKEGKTGHIFRGPENLANILKDYGEHNFGLIMEEDIRKLYEAEMNWSKNVKNLLKELI